MSERILIIEDNALNLKLAKITLEVEGFEISTAADGETGLKLLESSLPALILMDIQLPKMDGLKLARMIKSDPILSHIRIVAITAHAMKGDKEKTLAAGCDEYLAKPVEPKVLVETIRNCLQKNAEKSLQSVVQTNEFPKV